MHGRLVHFQHVCMRDIGRAKRALSYESHRDFGIHIYMSTQNKWSGCHVYESMTLGQDFAAEMGIPYFI